MSCVEHSSEGQPSTSANIEGYLSELTVTPGATVSVYLDSPTVQEVELALCDLLAPARGALDRTVEVVASVSPQVTRRGSFYEVDNMSEEAAASVAPVAGRSVSAFVYPTVLSGDVQAIVAWDGPSGLSALAISERGCPMWLSPTASVTSEHTLALHTWHLVIVTLSVDGVVIEHQPILNAYSSRYSPHLVSDSRSVTAAKTSGAGLADPDVSGGVGSVSVDPPPLPCSTRIAAAGTGDQVVWPFTGKIGPVAVTSGAVRFDGLRSDPAMVTSQTLSLWDPSRTREQDGPADRSASESELVDSGPNALDLSPVNSPVGNMTGPNWTGRSDHPVLVPDEYGARRYDREAVTNCGWVVAARIPIPDLCPPGVYGVRVRWASGLRYLPFVVGRAEVLEPKPKPESSRMFGSRRDRPAGFGSRIRSIRQGTGALAMVLPTMTYMAEAGRRTATAHAGAHTPLIPGGSATATDYGGSTLDTAADGSGICIGSRLRPMAELDPDVRSFDVPVAGRFGQDVGLLRFLRGAGYQVDVLTDEDLDRAGAGALSGYQAVLAGSYPAYASRTMLNAWEDYAASGGRVIYLGGGGFYWLASFNADRTMVEVRRGESGSRTWQADPGEYDHSFEGERCGLWRTKGRSPQKVFGVGLAADGRSNGIGFERMPDSFHKAVAWVFDGVEGGLIGSPSALAPLGAAALEVDRYDRLLGSPSHARILATATQLPEDYLKTVEEVLFNHPGLTGNQDAQVRSDMVMFTTRLGGAVFSVGSSAWTLGLGVDAADSASAVEQVTLNVVKAFAALAPITGARFDDEDDLVGLTTS